MVLHLRAPKGKVSVEVMLNRAKYFDRTGKVNDHTIYLSGNLGKNALEFAMCLSAKAKGGRVYTMGHTLVVEGADEAVLYFGADSTFRYASADVASWAGGAGRENYRKAGACDGTGVWRAAGGA